MFHRTLIACCGIDPPIRSIVAALPGVLFDTQGLAAHAYNEAFARHGGLGDTPPPVAMLCRLRSLPNFYYDVEHRLRLVLGTGGDVHESVASTKGANKLLWEEAQARPVDEALLLRLAAAYREVYAAGAGDPDLVRLRDGVPEALAALQEAGRPVALYSRGDAFDPTGHPAFAELAGRFANPGSCVRCVSSSGSEAYGALLEELRFPPAETLLVGDSAADEAAARAAGSRCAVVVDGRAAVKQLPPDTPVYPNFAAVSESLLAI